LEKKVVAIHVPFASAKECAEGRLQPVLSRERIGINFEPMKVIPFWRPMNEAEDPRTLARFVRAQEPDYERALAELVSGKKRTHWMWYIFPQLEGLGSSDISKRYALRGAAEARAYLDHPVLGPRLHACANALMAIEGRSAEEIMGYPDDLKLLSSATLFAAVLPSGSVFQRLIAKYYGGKPDGKTLRLLGTGPGPNRGG
jgi:uncharacterized protein (DUF1810 family)